MKEILIVSILFLGIMMSAHSQKVDASLQGLAAINYLSGNSSIGK